MPVIKMGREIQSMKARIGFVILLLILVWIGGCAKEGVVVNKTAPQPKEGKSSMDNMILIPSGVFVMGSDQGKFYEGPPRKVFLKSYYIDKYEVTNELFQRFVNEGGYKDPKYWSPEGWQWKESSRISYPGFWYGKEYRKDPFGWDYHKPEQPVAGLSWYEADAFCRWAGKRLPTEAEWEKAARGVDGRSYPWGNDPASCSYANYGGCQRFPTPVGSYEKGKSPYGLYDMAGNVWEWVDDWFSVDYFSQDKGKDILENPKGPEKGDLKTRKGGGWTYTEENIRTYARWRNPPNYRDYVTVKGCPIGLRCAKDAK